MADELRKSGIEVIGSVPWGTHFCQFYRTKQDLIDILVPYFKTGLENNEFCMWITAEPLKTTSARAALKRAVPDLDRYIEKGQIEIMPHTKWYLLGGKFDDERVLNGWVSKLEQALERDYSGLRLTGNTFWLERNGWQAFTDYEAKVNNVIGKYRMLAICTYCLDKCNGADVVDVVKNHQFALIKEKSKWDIIESAIYKQAKEALRETEEQLRLALDSANLGTFDYDLKARVVHWDEHTKRMCGIPRGHDPTYEEAAEFLHPDDRKQVETALAEAFAPGADGSYEAEFRIIRPDGSVIWNHAIGKVFFEGEGSNRKAVRQIGINQDITERKKTEEEIYHLSSFPELSPNPIVEFDEIGNIEYMNPAAAKLFPDLAEEGNLHQLRANWESLASALRRGESTSVTRDIAIGENWYMEAITYLPSTKTCRIYIWDIAKRKKAEEELSRLNRELRALSDCNQAIVRSTDEKTLLNDVCCIMCDVVGYRMAWVGSVEHDEAKSIRPIAWYGDDNGYLENANITWADTERGHGPTGIAARTGKTDFCQDFVTEPKAAPWREGALARGFRSSIAMPLIDQEGNVFAVLSLYASEPNGFTLAEVRLLEELTRDLSFGIGVLRTEQERIKVEEALRNSEEQFRRAIEEAPIPVIIHAEDGQVLQISRSWTELTGYTSQDMLTFNVWLNKACGESADEVREHVHQLFKGETASINVEFPIRTKDNHLRYWSFSVSSPGTLRDGRRFIVGMAVDITERKQSEQMKDEFIGMVSHEMRTPLTIITGSLLSALSPGISPDDARELIQNAAAGADSLAAILENMLELSRYQAGRLQLNMDMVNIGEVAGGVIAKLKAQGAGQQFNVDFLGDLPTVEADPMRVERILYNLVENATKYSPADSEIRISDRRDGDFIVTEIADHGKGISPDDQKKLFELFGRLEADSHTKGVGLGLVVCKRLVEAQGGWIKVESEVGQGSTFSFALPIRRTRRGRY
jgi:PAS domain S-box-containing protein